MGYRITQKVNPKVTSELLVEADRLFEVLTGQLGGLAVATLTAGDVDLRFDPGSGQYISRFIYYGGEGNDWECGHGEEVADVRGCLSLFAHGIRRARAMRIPNHGVLRDVELAGFHAARYLEVEEVREVTELVEGAEVDAEGLRDALMRLSAEEREAYSKFLVANARIDADTDYRSCRGDPLGFGNCLDRQPLWWNTGSKSTLL